MYFEILNKKSDLNLAGENSTKYLIEISSVKRWERWWLGRTLQGFQMIDYPVPQDVQLRCVDQEFGCEVKITNKSKVMNPGTIEQEIRYKVHFHW